MNRQDLPFELYSADQVRELDRTAIDEYCITGYELMCRAGQTVFEQVKAFCPEASSCAIFCGGGNNAGDGYVIARLAIAAGMEVTVYSVVEVSGLKGDALKAYRDCIDNGC
ncbi:MAG TPA: bifunctional ADP-dependent NAD(P)H-hydrate dehydratase/NAD(P)H-hydrate epimerase, partial [Methylococcaceae bacterium]|nr:bifunctional ADP-dependent NAD(P)H-hydrate dehydratase/NAD(P)H-hydrate epimerase [Methylococcaceae bacterium]